MGKWGALPKTQRERILQKKLRRGSKPTAGANGLWPWLTLNVDQNEAAE
jgi:hypothetical protein